MLQLPEDFQKDLKHICQTASKKANKTLNQTFGIEQKEGVQYVELSIAPSDFTKENDQEGYVLRNAANISKWKTLTIDQIFEPLPDKFESPRSTLILAGVGMGKTTVTQQRAYQWGSVESGTSTQALFRYQCREFRSIINVPISLADLLFKIHGPEVKPMEDVDVILNILDSPKTEIIFDGLDELDLVFQQEGNIAITSAHLPTSIPNLIYNLKEGNLLPNARILLSSRPGKHIVHRQFNRVIVIWGFSKSSINKYMMVLCRGNLEKFRFISAHIENTQLYVHCFVPLTCVILGVVLLHCYEMGGMKSSASEQTFLDRFTQLFIQVTMQIVDKMKESEGNWSTFLQTSTVRDSITRLIKLAASGMFGQERKIVFNAADLGEHNIVDTDINSGILECSSEYKPIYLLGDWKQATASFLHLSHQEFLAACFLAIHWDEKLLQNAISNLFSGRYDMIFLYTSGLLGDKKMGHMFLKSIEPTLNSDLLSDRLVQLIKKMYKVFKASDACTKKTTKIQMLMCLAEGRIESPVFATDTTLDLSQIPQGLLPHQLVAVSYHLKYNTITEIK